MSISRVKSEEELDALERPIHDAFQAFVSSRSLSGSDSPVFALTFKTGNAHFARKAMECVPPEVTLIIVGTALTDDEVRLFDTEGRPVFNLQQRFDNELTYELLLAHIDGDFGWVDADCFVVDKMLWRELMQPMGGRTANQAAFTYGPLGFAKTPLVCWNRDIRPVLWAERASMNSYSREVTHCCRASPYAISRLLTDRHMDLLKGTLGVDRDGALLPHEGLLDIFDGKRTTSSMDRVSVKTWLGPNARRTGWVLDTPILAQVVLRAVEGWETRRILPDNRRLSNQIIHPGASDYRQRIRDEGGGRHYLSRWRLTDLIEVLLIEELLEGPGAFEEYADTRNAQLHRMADEEGIQLDDVKRLAQDELREAGVDLDALGQNPVFSFLFQPARS